MNPTTQSSPWAWGAGFALYAVLMVGAAESEQWGEIAVALAWLVLLGAVAKWWTQLGQGITTLVPGVKFS